MNTHSKIEVPAKAYSPVAVARHYQRELDRLAKAGNRRAGQIARKLHRVRALDERNIMRGNPKLTALHYFLSDWGAAIRLEIGGEA